MIYQGKAITVEAIEGGIAELKFDLQGESVNKFNELTLTELSEAVAKVKADSSIKGLLLSSGKDVFIVGADITGFSQAFSMSEEELAERNWEVYNTFNAIEDLPIPTAVAINGLALGGGFEVCLTTDFRLMSSAAKVGFPEVKLGILPGWGGTVRFPRLCGADVAIEWICQGAEKKAPVALKDGAVDAIIEPELLRGEAIKLLQSAVAGDIEYLPRRKQKQEKLQLNSMEAMMAFETSKGFVAGQAGPNYPAPVEVIKVMQKAAEMSRDEALAVEAKGMAKLAKTPVAASLVGLFLNDQALKKVAKEYESKAAKIEKAAVLGAGIMGGGIAYQSASKGTPILMKDINQAGLDLGLNEANKLLAKRVDRKRMKPLVMGEALNKIVPTLSYGEFDSVDIVVEAVVENVKVKHAVLTEVEGHVGEDTIIASNTSTISITKLAEPLKRPENFCGMHFFNPVHMMPLVEVIRGEKSSEKAIATTVAYAKRIGKTPVVVNDCPGFMVNRVLFPYFAGFSGLLRDGADFQKVDKVMERFGWPMGPAYLIDVVGIDTGAHGRQVMADGFPDRMGDDSKTASDVLYEAGHYGQKTGKGFYLYETDKKGKPKKVKDETTYDLLKDVLGAPKDFSDEEIVDRMMIPLCLEVVRCLEDKIVDTPEDADMSLIMGVGFPPFRGGALRYIDSMGVDAFVEKADKYADLGPLYAPTERLREMAKNGETFFGN